MRIHNPQITGSLEVSSSASNKHYFIGANVGIGAKSPATLLEVSGSEPTIRISDTAASGKYFNRFWQVVVEQVN